MSRIAVVNNSHAVTLQLSPSDTLPVSGAFYGMGNGSIFLDNVLCRGSESNLLQCTRARREEFNCDHSEDAGVRCDGTIVFAWPQIFLTKI